MILRLITAAALLVSGVDHFRLWRHFGDRVHIVGPMFLVQAIACVVVAILLVAWRHWLAPLMAVALAAGTLVGFTIATLPSGLLSDHEKWRGTTVWVAAISEIVVIAAGLLAFFSEYRSAGRVPQEASVRS